MPPTAANGAHAGSAAAFAHAVDNARADVELFVPGRLALLGEHSDWAGGFRTANSAILPGQCLVVGTEQGLYARAKPLQKPVLRMRTVTEDGQVQGFEDFPLDEPEELAARAQRGGFWSYVAGMAYKLSTDFEVGGLELDNYRTTLPLKKGLSSSAAVCVLVARAYNIVYGLKLSTRGEMQYAYEGERLTPSRCGKMDQGCAFGSVPVLMTFDGDLLHCRPLQLGAPLHLVLVDLRAAKDTVTILARLQEAYPHPATPQHAALHTLLGRTNEQFTARAVECMASGDAEGLGQVMVEAQQAFDEAAGPCCPEQLTAPVLHSLLSYAPLQRLLYGGKGVGSQGDGTAQLLCRDAACQAAACEIVEGQLGMHAMPLTIAATGGAGATAAKGAAYASAYQTTGAAPGLPPLAPHRARVDAARAVVVAGTAVRLGTSDSSSSLDAAAAAGFKGDAVQCGNGRATAVATP